MSPASKSKPRPAKAPPAVEIEVQSPLWDIPNVIASPHSAGFSDGNAARVEEVFLDNLGRRLQGQPLRNVVG